MARLFTVFSAWFLLSMAGLGLFGSLATASSDGATVTVAKIDGNGTVKIRRASGIEASAVVGDRLAAGDKILTDNESTVDLVLHDRSLVRVGMNTDYKVESISEEKPGLWSWAFDMATGSIRALVETSQQKGFVKFKVNTPSGTMGVRGTEIILSERQGVLELITIHGEALLGPRGADFKNVRLFEPVSANMRSRIKAGQRRATKPILFTTKQLLIRRGTSVDEDVGVLLGVAKNVKDGSISETEADQLVEKAKMEFDRTKDSFSKSYASPKEERASVTKGQGVASKAAAAAPIGSQRKPIKGSKLKTSDASVSEKREASATKSSSLQRPKSTRSSTLSKAPQVSDEQLKEMNSLYEDSRTALEMAPPVDESFSVSMKVDSTKSAATGAVPPAPVSGTVEKKTAQCTFKTTYYARGNCVKENFWGDCKKRRWDCKISESQAACPAGSKPGSIIQNSSECVEGTHIEKSE